VAEGTPAELVDRHGPGVSLSFTLPAPDVAGLRAVPGVEAVVVSGSHVEVHGRRSMIAPVGAHLVARSTDGGRSVPDDIRVTEPTLESALLELLGGDTPIPVPEEVPAA